MSWFSCTSLWFLFRLRRREIMVSITQQSQLMNMPRVLRMEGIGQGCQTHSSRVWTGSCRVSIQPASNWISPTYFSRAAATNTSQLAFSQLPFLLCMGQIKCQASLPSISWSKGRREGEGNSKTDFPHRWENKIWTLWHL